MKHNYFEVGKSYRCKIMHRPRTWNELGKMDFALNGILRVVGIKEEWVDGGILDLVKFEGQPYWAFSLENFSEEGDPQGQVTSVVKRISRFNNLKLKGKKHVK